MEAKQFLALTGAIALGVLVGTMVASQIQKKMVKA
jgi:hypothetical protein